MLIINKHFDFCCFRALAYTTLDRLCAVFYITHKEVSFGGLNDLRLNLGGKISQKLKFWGRE